MNKVCCGPGYASPIEAINAPREKLLYTIVKLVVGAHGHRRRRLRLGGARVERAGRGPSEHKAYTVFSF